MKLKLVKIKKIERIPFKGYLYDITSLPYHNFLANDIIVHNCEGTLGRRIQKGWREIPVRTEDGKTISVEMKMNVQTIEGLSVSWDTPIMVKENGVIKILPIGSLIDKYLQSEGIVKVDGLEVPSFDENGKISFKSVKYLIKHKSNGKMLEIITKTGRRVKVSKGHSLFVLKDCSIKTMPSDKLVVGDYIIIPKRLPANPLMENLEIVKVDDLNLKEYKLLDGKISRKKRISYPPFALPIKEIGLDKICDLIKEPKLKELAKSYIHNLRKGRKHIGIDIMEKIIEKIDKEKTNEEEKKIVNLIEKFVKGDITVDIIESIKEVEGSEFEYDISVEKNENFVGGIGGIMLHNSGHSDRNQLLAFIHKLSSKPDRVIIAHGESQKSLELARAIHKIFRVETNVPRNLESLRLK